MRRESRNYKPKVKSKQNDTRKDFSKGQKFKCKKCGMEHLPKNCPAYGKTCNRCHKPNHFKKMCNNKRVYTVEEEEISDDDLYIGSIENQEKDSNSWMVNLNLNGKIQKFKLDTGAQANVIPYKIYKLVKGNSKLIPSKSRLVTYSGEKMHVLGKCNISVLHKDKSENVEFAVVHLNAQCILELKSCEKFNLISRVMSVETNYDNY